MMQTIIEKIRMSGSRLVLAVLFGIFIGAVIYIPDPETALAVIFMGDQFHHFDSYLAAPGWAFNTGQKLNVDVISQYGVGMPMFLAGLGKLFGAYSYLNVLLVLVYASIFYFLLSFWLLQKWFNNLPLAMAGILVGLKTQMFHPGIYPFVFAVPSAAVVRNWFDIVFFLLILFHLENRRSAFLWAAAVTCGLSVFYMTSMGLCLTLSFYLYLGGCALTKELRSGTLWSSVIHAAAVPATTLFCFLIAQEQHIWSSQFWANMKEFDRYFISGFGLMPVTETLSKGDYWASVVGFVIPLVYILTVLIIGTLLYFKRTDYRNLFVIVLSFYGLGAYHYYIARSAPTSYYVVGLPYVFVLCFWGLQVLKALPAKLRRMLPLVAVLVCFYGLWTTPLFRSYPNIFDLAPMPSLPDGRNYFNHAFTRMTEKQKLAVNSLGTTEERLKTERDFRADGELKRFFKEEFKFAEDAALITRFVPPSAKAAVISSFEVKILIEAKRPPFFYYFPFILSRPMSMRTWPNSTMYTRGHLERTMSQIQKERPDYIFVEAIFLANGAFEYNDMFLVSVIKYIREHYVPVEQGRYLVAMKIKEEAS